MTSGTPSAMKKSFFQNVLNLFYTISLEKHNIG